MRRANLVRREQSDLARETITLQVVPDAFCARLVGEHSADIFDEYPMDFGFGDDPSSVWPEIAFVVGSGATSGERVGLTGYPANEAMNETTPRSAVEGPHIIPDRRRSQATFFHRRNQSCDAECFPLHISDRSAWDGQFDAEIQSSDAGAQ